MANFVENSLSVSAGSTLEVKLWGGGPDGNALKVQSTKPQIVTTKAASHSGGDPDIHVWKVTGIKPGKANIEARTNSNQLYAEPIEVIVTGRIIIKFRPDGEGSMDCKGLGKFRVLGEPGRAYPRDITVYPNDKESVHKSVEYNVDMPFAIKIWGQKGIFIHEFPDNLRDNGGPSAGCIHVGKGNASQVFDYVVTRTRITIEYPW